VIRSNAHALGGSASSLPMYANMQTSRKTAMDTAANCATQRLPSMLTTSQHRKLLACALHRNIRFMPRCLFAAVPALYSMHACMLQHLAEKLCQQEHQTAHVCHQEHN
jgi:hypothetical protein